MGRLILILIVLVALVVAGWWWLGPARQQQDFINLPPSATGPWVAFGDSLTQGKGRRMATITRACWQSG
jgi:hypothetical protein